LQYAVNQATENIKKLENKVLSLNNNLTEKWQDFFAEIINSNGFNIENW
jgi:hypothetical protein